MNPGTPAVLSLGTGLFVILIWDYRAISCLQKALKEKSSRCSETVNRFNTMLPFRVEPCRYRSQRSPQRTLNHLMSQRFDMNPPNKSAQTDSYTLLRAALTLFNKKQDALHE